MNGEQRAAGRQAQYGVMDVTRDMVDICGAVFCIPDIGEYASYRDP